jgi:hypothetical protein
MKIKKTYESQALAIAMVVMVVSSIIAMSVFFRSQKDKTLTLEERASAEALEISDLIIDKLTLYPIKEVMAMINKIRTEESKEEFDYIEGTVPPLKENNTTQEISTLLSRLGMLDSIRNLSICPVQEGLNEYELTIREADENTYFEIRPGQVWSLPIKGLEIDVLCQVLLGFDVRGSTQAGFVLFKSYAKYIPGLEEPQEYKKYEYEDITNYCFADSSGRCNSQDINFLDNDWEPYFIENRNFSVPINLKEQKVIDGEIYSLDEIRIKAVGGTIGIKYASVPLELNCLQNLRMINLRVSANCYGIYRGKEVLIPEAKWHNVLFDYAVFNGEGSI